MTTTGYEVEQLGGSTTHVCADCADPDDADAVSVTPDGRRVTAITTSQFRQGNGGGPCVLCGLDVLNPLASRALAGDTPRELATSTDHEVSDLAAVAAVVDVATDAFVTITTGPGVEPERTAHAPGVATVAHPDDAPETLVVEFARDDGEEGRALAACEQVAAVLERGPLSTVVLADNRGDGASDAVHAVRK